VKRSQLSKEKVVVDCVGKLRSFGEDKWPAKTFEYKGHAWMAKFAYAI